MATTGRRLLGCSLLAALAAAGAPGPRFICAQENSVETSFAYDATLVASVNVIHERDLSGGGAG